METRLCIFLFLIVFNFSASAQEKTKKELKQERELKKLNEIKNGKVFENSRVKFEIENYKKEIELKESKIDDERRMFYSIIGVIFIIVLFIILTLRNLSIKHKQRKLIAERNEQIVSLELEKEKNENLLLEKMFKEKETSALLEQERLKNEIELKNRKLSAKALYLSGRNELIEETLQTLSKLPEISKDADFNFTFFSLATGNTVAVEPQKAKWDLNFTVFTNYFNMGSGDVTYGFSDFITTNAKSGTQVYQVLVTADVTYAAFAKANVVESNFTLSKTDQRVIGSNWRSGGGPTTLPSIRADRFYVVKDPAGNIYKLKFTGGLKEDGERGFPKFQYSLLK